MDAGRELDALIAEKIMGLTPHLAKEGEMLFTIHRDFVENGDYWYELPNHAIDEVPLYSTEIAAAWLVVEKMRGPDFRLNKEGDWVCCFGGDIAYCGEADTPMLAICRAALKTTEA